eukprot:TRINITY_DN17590_c0_g1_i1.p1 TRINITY_DN17590_c0_g1~~TRINITY_DN17590_c0_g1_i1.p1  ORF type:complete len:226 (+),score=48.23 TRINITY_DN17590_c0_g1_i1:62-739(+)
MPKKKKGKGGSKKGKVKAETSDSIEHLLEERFYMGPNYAEKRKERYRAKINEAFSMFERHVEGGNQNPRERICDWREVKTIVRSLNLNPTKEQIASILDEVEEPEPSAFIRYDRLEEVLLDILMNNEYVPKNKRVPAEGETEEFTSNLLVRDTEETIIDAFRALDTSHKGEIEAEALGNLMMKFGRAGEDFEREEVVDMVQAAADPDSGLIKYEDSLYIDQLTND